MLSGKRHVSPNLTFGYMTTLASGRGLAGEEHDLRVDLLALLRSHVLVGQIALHPCAQQISSACMIACRTYLDDTHDVERLTLRIYLRQLQPQRPTQ